MVLKNSSFFVFIELDVPILVLAVFPTHSIRASIFTSCTAFFVIYNLEVFWMLIIHVQMYVTTDKVVC